MHAGSLDHLTHPHVFLGAEHDHNERRTWFVVGLSDAPAAPSSYKVRLMDIPGLSLVAVEVEACAGDHPHSRKAA